MTSSKERPILFSAPMVKSILEGRKTQTRRVVKCPDDTIDIQYVEESETFPKGLYSGWVINCSAPLRLPIKCPYGEIGDRLWVRETWQGYRQVNIEYDEWEEMESPKDRHDDFYSPVYKADKKNFPEKWLPSIHMPRAYSRILLEIIDIRIERLQDICEGDALEEGIEWTKTGDHFEGDVMYHCKNYMAEGKVVYAASENEDLDEDLLDTEVAIDPESSFKSLWQSINKKPGTTWEENPFVWVIEFERIKNGTDN